MEFSDRARLPDLLRSQLASELSSLGMLQEVVRWAFALDPPRDIAEVITQDEFTHDVVIPWVDRLTLVFDCT